MCSEDSDMIRFSMVCKKWNALYIWAHTEQMKFKADSF